MSEFETLIKVLATQLSENPNLRYALVETILAVLGEEEAPDEEAGGQPSYLDLLEGIEKNRLLAQKAGKKKISAALQELEGQLRYELEQSVLALHHVLQTGHPAPDEEHVRRVGVDITNFPVGFPQAHNLLEESEHYLKAARDLHFLHEHFPDRLSGVAQKLIEEKTQAAQWLHEIVWQVLQAESSHHAELDAFRKTCLDQLLKRRTQAEDGLSSILQEADQHYSPELPRKLEDWLRKFGVLSLKLLKELSPTHKRTALELLLRIHSYSGLEALIALDPEKKQRGYFDTLMTLRFGQAFHEFSSTWKTWLERHIDEATQRQQAVTFWKEHRYSIPGLLVEWLQFPDYPPLTPPRRGMRPSEPISREELGISESLYARMLEEMGGAGLEEILESRRSMMTAEEIQVLEGELQPAPVSMAEEEALKFDVEEAEEALTDQGVEPQSPEEPSPPSPIIESVVETAIDLAMGGNLVDSAIITTIDRGAETFDGKLTVTIEEEEPSTKVRFAPEKKEPEVEEEPEESLWRDHIFPFVADNWVFVVSMSLLFIGQLLLVFTWWDTKPLIRYGLTPLMIVSIAYILSRIGLWLKGEDIQSDVPIFLVQSVSIFLAPMSLLFVALLSVDKELSLLIRVVGGLALAAALLIGWTYIFLLAVKSVYRAMSDIHSYTLLFLNALLLLLPVAQSLLSPDSEGLNLGTRAILVAGFYVGFLVLCWSMRKMLGRMLTKGITVSRIPIVFYSVTCLGTFALVWGLTHARLMLLPQPYTYGPLLLLLSFLISMVEFKLLEIRAIYEPEVVQENPPLPPPRRGIHPPGPPQGDADRMQALPGQDAGMMPALPGIHFRITSLSYASYFFIGLGVILCIGHEYLRVISLFLAGLVWFYQALRLSQILSVTSPSIPSLKSIAGKYVARHFSISLILLMLGFSVIALVKDFPAPFFPYLTLCVALGLYGVSLRFPLKEIKTLAASLSPIYLSFAFVISILWQWAEGIDPLGYGFAFVFFGIFCIYLGAKTDTLIHVHAGAGYCVAALPYLGSVDMNLYTLQGNTLVFGLALVGIFWTMVSTASQNLAVRDSRSTVLWNIGILAFCIMCLRLILKDTLDFSANPMLQFQILSGPVIIGGLMLLAGYFTRSYVAVYLALVILVIIFPEIKDRFNIPMYSGLGSTMSGIGFLMLALVLKPWKRLHKSREPDLVWRKKPFPFQAKNSYLLFANPVVVAAFFLFIRTICVTYPLNYFRPLLPFTIKTPIAVLLCGTAFHFFSVWWRKTWFSYIGFIAIFFGILHSCYVDAGIYSDELFLPLFILTAFLYCEGIRFAAARILPAEKAEFISVPFRRLKYIALWIFAFGFLLFYSLYSTLFYQVSFFRYWLPLLLYLCGVSVWLAWHVRRPGNSWFSLLPGYLLFWQLVTLVTTRGDLSFYVLSPNSGFYLNTSLMVLGIVAFFFLLEYLLPKICPEQNQMEKFRVLCPLLWISLILLLVFSSFLVAAFYDVLGFFEFPALIPQIIVWALISFILGRFLNFGPLWLWSLFLLHLVFLPSVKGYARHDVSFHPFTLACIALFPSALSFIVAKAKWLYEHKYSYPWVQYTLISPAFLFAVGTLPIVGFAFFQASFNPLYRHEWITVAGLFLTAISALLAAHQLGLSRRFLCSVPYTLAWVALMFAIQDKFPKNYWLMHLQIPLIVCCGLFAALATSVLNEYFFKTIGLSPRLDTPYRAFKYAVAAGMLVLVGATYLGIRDIEMIGWQWLVTSGLLSLGTGVYFRYFEEGSRR